MRLSKLSFFKSHPNPWKHRHFTLATFLVIPWLRRPIRIQFTFQSGGSCKNMSGTRLRSSAYEIMLHCAPQILMHTILRSSYNLTESPKKLINIYVQAWAGMVQNIPWKRQLWNWGFPFLLFGGMFGWDMIVINGDLKVDLINYKQILSYLWQLQCFCNFCTLKIL